MGTTHPLYLPHLFHQLFYLPKSVLPLVIPGTNQIQQNSKKLLPNYRTPQKITSIHTQRTKKTTIQLIVSLIPPHHHHPLKKGRVPTTISTTKPKITLHVVESNFPQEV